MLTYFLKTRIGKKIFKLPYKGFGINTTERVVEIPWALSAYEGEKKVLEIGYAHAEPEYINGILNLNCEELHGVDIAYKDIQGFVKKQQDIRNTDYPDNFFDMIYCISTIEHVGRDNMIYTKTNEQIDEDGDYKVAVELSRILNKNGKLVITVPYGKLVDYGWFIHYDEDRWCKLKAKLGLNLIKEDYFIYDNGWSYCDKSALSGIGYNDNSAPAACGLVCALFVK